MNTKHVNQNFGRSSLLQTCYLLLLGSATQVTPAQLQTVSQSDVAKSRKLVSTLATRAKAGDWSVLKSLEAYINDPAVGCLARSGLGIGLCIQGNYARAIEVLTPLLPLSLSDRSSVPQDAWVTYERCLTKLNRSHEIFDARKKVHSKTFTLGYSFDDFNKNGIDDDRVVDLLKMLMKDQTKPSALTHDWKKIVAGYPQSEMLLGYYVSWYDRAFKSKGLDLVLEDYYKHSQPTFRTKMKSRYYLDYARIDASLKP